MPDIIPSGFYTRFAEGAMPSGEDFHGLFDHINAAMPNDWDVSLACKPEIPLGVINMDGAIHPSTFKFEDVSVWPEGVSGSITFVLDATSSGFLETASPSGDGSKGGYCTWVGPTGMSWIAGGDPIPVGVTMSGVIASGNAIIGGTTTAKVEYVHAADEGYPAIDSPKANIWTNAYYQVIAPSGGQATPPSAVFTLKDYSLWNKDEVAYSKNRYWEIDLGAYASGAINIITGASGDPDSGGGDSELTLDVGASGTYEVQLEVWGGQTAGTNSNVTTTARSSGVVTLVVDYPWGTYYPRTNLSINKYYIDLNSVSGVVLSSAGTQWDDGTEPGDKQYRWRCASGDWTKIGNVAGTWDWTGASGLDLWSQEIYFSNNDIYTSGAANGEEFYFELQSMDNNWHDGWGAATSGNLNASSSGVVFVAQETAPLDVAFKGTFLTDYDAANDAFVKRDSMLGNTYWESVTLFVSSSTWQTGRIQYGTESVAVSSGTLDTTGSEAVNADQSTYVSWTSLADNTDYYIYWDKTATNTLTLSDTNTQGLNQYLIAHVRTPPTDSLIHKTKLDTCRGGEWVPGWTGLTRDGGSDARETIINIRPDSAVANRGVVFIGTKPSGTMDTGETILGNIPSDSYTSGGEVAFRHDVDLGSGDRVAYIIGGGGHRAVINANAVVQSALPLPEAINIVYIDSAGTVQASPADCTTPGAPVGAEPADHDVTLDASYSAFDTVKAIATPIGVPVASGAPDEVICYATTTADGVNLDLRVKAYHKYSSAGSTYYQQLGVQVVLIGSCQTIPNCNQ